MLLLFTAMLAVSTSPIIARYLENVPAVSISFWRMGFGALILWVVSLVKKQAPLKNKNLKRTLIAGILLGWVYFKNGFPTTVMLHWSFNFLPSSYVYFTCADNISIGACNQVAESSFLVNAFEALILITGILSIGMIILNKYAK